MARSRLDARLAASTGLQWSRPSMNVRLISLEEQVRPAPRVAILNGFGRTLGDGIIGLQALHLAMRLAAVPAPPTLFRLGNLPPLIQSMHMLADIADIKTLAAERAMPGSGFEGADGYDQTIDIRDFAFAPDFQRTSMIDFFLRRLGVAPQFVPPALKRNSWLAPRVVTESSTWPRGYVLVCPRSSTPLRDMPDEIHHDILRQLAVQCPVVTQGSTPADLADEVLHAPACATFTELCTLVRHARWVISTDTAMVHLADAFEVPCLAFFPTHRPEWRVRDYPRCVAIALRSTMPPGLEFARGTDDHALARSAWFPDGMDLGWLRHAVAGCRAWL